MYAQVLVWSSMEFIGNNQNRKPQELFASEAVQVQISNSTSQSYRQ